MAAAAAYRRCTVQCLQSSFSRRQIHLSRWQSMPRLLSASRAAAARDRSIQQGSSSSETMSSGIEQGMQREMLEEDEMKGDEPWYAEPFLSVPSRDGQTTKAVLHPFPSLPEEFAPLRSFLEPLHPDALRKTSFIDLTAAKNLGESWVGRVMVCVAETETGKGRSVPSLAESISGRLLEMLINNNGRRSDVLSAEMYPKVIGYPQGRHALGLRPEWLIIDSPVLDLLVHVVTPATEEMYAIEELWLDVVRSSASEEGSHLT